MTDVRFLATDSSFELMVRPEPLPLRDEQRRAIDRCWDEQLAALHRGSSDGMVLTCVSADRRRLVGRFVGLRDFLVGRAQPRLFDWAPPVPVGVCGRISCGGRVLLGRRAPDQGAWAGCWELAPSNDLDRAWSVAGDGRLDVRANLRAALDATTPLGSVACSHPEPFALAYDEGESAWRVCLALEALLDGAAVERLEASRSQRYDAFRVVRPVDVIEAGMLGGSDLVPLTGALVRLPAPILNAAG